MKKQGFTLIELMVVIVIMGILAAVAVPKLFGMIAKSKASEVGPAGGEYIKLQDAFAAESGTFAGNWQAIGYALPISSNFEYTEVETAYTGDIPTLDFVTNAGAHIGWQAKNKVALNDCATNSTWQLQYSHNTGVKGTLQYDVVISANACNLLTPNFGKMDKEGVAEVPAS